MSSLKTTTRPTELSWKTKPKSYNLMHPIRWVPPEARSVLDVGCNIGAFLSHIRQVFPAISLAGVEVNQSALEVASADLPEADLHHAGAESLPFPDEGFDCVTCIEVLEHIPAELRRASIEEMRRVLRPGGRLVLRTPRAGLFAFLDANNFRFRFPWLYRRLVARGGRDFGYDSWSSGVVWHHHFHKQEILDLAGEGWEVEAIRSGGLLLFPLGDIGNWYFYRRGRHDHPICKALSRLMALDLGINYGPASIDILVILRRL